MKKTLLTLAFMAAAATAAQAASVTLYGSVDGGFSYLHTKNTPTNTTLLKFYQKVGKGDGASTSAIKLAGGLGGANKFGLKGVEDIGDNLKVGFKLEGGFDLMDGSLKSGKLFARETQLFVEHAAVGKLAFGRFGGLNSSAGSFDTFFAVADAFDGGDNDVPTGFVMSSRYDNSMAYHSPEIMGLQFTAMYSFNTNGKQADKPKNNNRYLGVGATYNWDKLNVVFTTEREFSSEADRLGYRKDQLTFNVGANYDFEVVKLFAGAQVARHANMSNISALNLDSVASDIGAPSSDPLKANQLYTTQRKGFAGTVGAVVPLGKSSLTSGVYYGKYKNETLTENLKVMGVSVRYEHALSNRTKLYVGAGGSKAESTAWFEQRMAQVYAGLHHNF